MDCSRIALRAVREEDDTTVFAVARGSLLERPALQGPAGGAGDATGEMLWAGATALACALHARRAEVFPPWSSRPVVELGAGCGMVGALAARHASRVVLTDGSARAVDLASHTLTANGVSPDRSSTGVLSWPSSEGGVADSADQAARVLRSLLLPSPSSSSSSSSSSSPLLLLAAEVVYPSTTSESLVGLLWLARHLLEACGGASVGAGGRGGGADDEQPPPLDGPLLLMSYVPRAPVTSVRLLAALHVARWDAALIPWQSYTRVEPGLGAVVLACTARGVDVGRGGTRAQAAAVDALTASLVRGERGAEAGDVVPLLALLSRVFPDALPAVARLAALRAEQEEEAAAWGPPHEDSEKGW